MIKIFTHKVKTIRNIIKNNTGKIQTADKISETNLRTGNTEDAKQIACVFNKLFLLKAENYMLVIQTYTHLYND